MAGLLKQSGLLKKSGSGGAGLAVNTRFFPYSAATNAAIDQLKDPFGTGSVFSTVGAVPGQLQVSAGGAVTKGATAAVVATAYSVKIRCDSADGKSAVETTLAWTADYVMRTLTVAGSLSFTLGAAAGTVFNPIVNIQSGIPVSIVPNDDRLEIDGSNRLVLGSGLWTPGAATFALRQLDLLSGNTLDSTITITAIAPSAPAGNSYGDGLGNTFGDGLGNTFTWGP